MSFDVLAPHYFWIEQICAGNLLQRCRLEFLSRLQGAKSILILGEGNGRFLLECCRANPEAAITCVDASPRMLSLARKRLQRARLGQKCVRFLAEDGLQWTPPRAYDAIVTHFFLDCFRADQLPPLISRIGAAAAENAIWLVADFRLPDAGAGRWRAWIILRSLYVFFRCVTRLPARELTPPDQFLTRAGFRLEERRLHDWGLLHSDCWRRGA